MNIDAYIDQLTKLGFQHHEGRKGVLVTSVDGVDLLALVSQKDATFKVTRKGNNYRYRFPHDFAYAMEFITNYITCIRLENYDV